MVLASAKEDDLDKLASLADRVAEVATPSVSVIETSQLSAEVEQPQVLGYQVSFFHLISACA